MFVCSQNLRVSPALRGYYERVNLSVAVSRYRNSQTAHH